MKTTTRYIFVLCVTLSSIALADELSVHFPPPSPPIPVTAETQDWPISVEAAVNRMILEMTDETKESIRSMPDTDLIKLHHSMGRGIRNRFGLWKGNNELLKDTGANEPDAASMFIIKALWKRLNEKGA